MTTTFASVQVVDKIAVKYDKKCGVSFNDFGHVILVGGGYSADVTPKI